MSVRILAVLTALLLDLAVKTMIATEPGLMHPTPDWHQRAVLCVFVLAAAILCPLRPYESLPLAVVAGGALSNTIDSIDGYVRNPLTINIWDGTLGYNPADLCITVGAAGFMLVVVRPMMQRMLLGATQNPAD